MAHPNPQNLVVPTSEQARINGAKGGKASAEAKKKRRTMADILEGVLSKESTNEEAAEKLKKAGYIGTENVHMVKIISALVKKAEAGDLKAIELISKMMYGDFKNTVDVNLEGEVKTESRVKIYLPEIEKQETEDGEGETDD